MYRAIHIGYALKISLSFIDYEQSYQHFSETNHSLDQIQKILGAEPDLDRKYLAPKGLTYYFSIALKTKSF